MHFYHIKIFIYKCFIFIHNNVSLVSHLYITSSQSSLRINKSYAFHPSFSTQRVAYTAAILVPFWVV